MASPTTGILDNFNRANGDVGSNWNPTDGLTVSNNTCVGNSTANVVTWVANSFGTNQECYFTITAMTGQDLDIILKCATAGTYTGGCIEIYLNAATGAGDVEYYNSGWGTVPSSSFSGFQVGDQFWAQAKSDGHIIVYRNGTQLVDVDANSVFAGSKTGYIGIWNPVAENGIDDFGGGDIVSGQPANVDALLGGALGNGLKAETALTSLTQYSFRFRHDDGSESAATWLADLNAAASAGTLTPVRLRFLINALGDNAAGQFQLECRKVGGSTWSKVT